MNEMQATTRTALAVESVTHARFQTFRDGRIRGVVFDSLTGIEFDVSRDGHLWNVNDDHGRNHRSFGLRRALRKAIRRNKP